MDWPKAFLFAFLALCYTALSIAAVITVGNAAWVYIVLIGLIIFTIN